MRNTQKTRIENVVYQVMDEKKDAADSFRAIMDQRSDFTSMKTVECIQVLAYTDLLLTSMSKYDFSLFEVIGSRLSISTDPILNSSSI